MYMHRIENASAKVNDLLAAADYFQMDGLKEAHIRHHHPRKLSGGEPKGQKG
jgi:hypothetical protein